MVLPLSESPTELPLLVPDTCIPIPELLEITFE